jgi:hypothetical protein
MRHSLVHVFVVLLVGLSLTTVFAAEQDTPAVKSEAVSFTASPVVTLDGTVKQPSILMQVDNQFGTEHVKLITDKGAMKVALAPRAYVKKIGLEVKGGEKITVTGWQVTRKGKTELIAQEIKVGDKTYTLRQADGQAAWEGQQDK